MLKGVIYFESLHNAPVIEQQTIEIGISSLCLHKSIFLECLLVESDERWFASFRERQVATAQELSIRYLKVSIDEYFQLYSDAVLWPLDYNLIEVLPAERKVQVRSGALGVAPIYCYSSKSKLVISWDSTDFLNYTQSIDTEYLVSALSLERRYSARQILYGVYMITERAVYTVSPEGASFKYPDSKVYPFVPDKINEREYLDILTSELESILLIRPVHFSKVAVELSGGVDSSSIAVLLKRCAINFKTFGVILRNDSSVLQEERRLKLLNILGSQDFIVRLSEFIPNMEPNYNQNDACGPIEEFYLSAFSALWDTAQRERCNVIFKGFGGDELGVNESEDCGADSRGLEHVFRDIKNELMFYTPRALEMIKSLPAFDAPDSPVSHSSLMTQSRHAPHALKRGLWPVNVLSDPRIINLSLRFPRRLRVNRIFLSNYVNTHLRFPVFSQMYAKETFLGTLPYAINCSASTIKSQLKECMIADLGLIDRSKLLKAIDHIGLTQCESTSLQVSMTILLERFLRSIQRKNLQ